MQMEINTQPEKLSLPSKTEELLRTVLQKTATLLDVEEDAEVTAIFQGKYSTRYPALVNGINIVFINSTPQAELLLSEVVHEEAA